VPRRESEEGKGRREEKKSKSERKGTVRKRGNLHNRFRVRRIRPPVTVTRPSVIRIYIESSISIYNTSSPHAAASLAVAAVAGRKSHRAENGFSWKMWRARYAYNTTHQRSDDIAKLKRRILSGRIESAGCVTKEIIVVVWFREIWRDVSKRTPCHQK